MEDSNKQTQKKLEESYKTIGKLLGESLGEGILQSQDKAKNAADALSVELLESQRHYLQEKERLEQEEEAAQEAKYRRDYENRLRKARTAAQAEIVRQNEQLRLQKKSNQEYLAALEAHLDAVEEKIRAQKERITDEFNQIAKKASASLEELEESREEMAEKLRDYGGIFDDREVVFKNAGPNGTPIRLKTAVLDLSDEREQLERYAELLQQVQKMENVPQAIFSEIRKLSVDEALRYQEKLLKMSDVDRQQYLEDWQAIQVLSDEVSQVGYTEAVGAVLSEIEQELSEWYGTIPDGFFVEGELAADAFGEGFTKELEALRSELEEAVLNIVPTVGSISGFDKENRQKNRQESNYSVTYVLNSAGETVSQQLRSAKLHADVVRMRGV